jgi:hypothetical protein
MDYEKNQGVISDEVKYLQKLYSVIGKLEVDPKTNKPIDREVFVHRLENNRKKILRYRDSRNLQDDYNITKEVMLDPVSFYKFIEEKFVLPNVEEFDLSTDCEMRKMMEEARCFREQKAMVNIYKKADVNSDVYFNNSCDKTPYLTERAKVLIVHASQLEKAATSVTSL